MKSSLRSVSRRRPVFPAALLLTLTLLTALASAQQLTVQDENGKKTVLTAAEIEALPRVKVTAGASGATATFEGVALRAVLDKAGVGLGETLRGKRLASCLLIEAADGYRAVIALPEIDPAFNDKQMVLAFFERWQATR
jgi:hypothetical protein